MQKNILFVGLLSVICFSCNTLKYVPQNEELLTKVDLKVTEGAVSKKNLKSTIRQQPNVHFWGTNLNLGIYSLSGKDTTKWINRSLRKIGEPPVLYRQIETDRSEAAMSRYLFNKGYFNAEVEAKSYHKNQKVNVVYHADLGKPYHIQSYRYQPSGNALDSLVAASLPESSIREDVVFDSEVLNAERDRLAAMAREQGYYAINKEHFSFQVDSSLNNHHVDIRLQIKPYTRVMTDEEVRYEKHVQYRINKVYFLLDVPSPAIMNSAARAMAGYDTLQIDDYCIVYQDRPCIRAKTLLRNCFVAPGDLYRAKAVSKTYSRMNSMQHMKYVNIRFVEQGQTDASEKSERLLDCYILVTSGNDNIFSFEIEGTNTAGDLGVAGSLTYSHLNLMQGGEVFSTRLRGAYETLSNSFANDYREFGGEMNLLYPEFKIPFFSRDFKRNIDATTNWRLSYDNLSRPEFLRTTTAVSLEYAWQDQKIRQTLNPVDLAYVYMPRVDSTFQATYLKEGSYLKYSYEDQFILRTAYSILYSSLPLGVTNKTYYTLRANVESAGNLLRLVGSMADISKENGAYTIAGIPFSQYVKGEFELTRNIVLNSNSRLAYRIGIGAAYPYGNSKILPFEKRFYSGGANSVRGWSVRTLGPGTYKTSLTSIDFMNQSGDIKLDLGIEIRRKMFWVLESAFFVDAGNIWTIRDYDNQAGGRFHIDTFYKQLACSAGLGLRLDFKFFLLRVDGGMKVFDPSGSTGDERWRIKHIDDWDDFALHFAIGYPF